MPPIAFCSRCRGMKVGWNKQYMLHCLVCQARVTTASKFLVLTGLLSLFLFAFPVSTGVPANSAAFTQSLQALPVAEIRQAAEAESAAQVTRMLSRHGAEEENVPRVVRAILASSAKYDVDPRLIASIIIVESGANPFAVSSAESIGMMQIHLRTWGKIADSQNINLFKVEDNIDFGVRILRDYIAASDLWRGVARYRGWTDTPESQLSAEEYVRKVQRIYGITPEGFSL